MTPPDLSAYPHLICYAGGLGYYIRCASNDEGVQAVACYVAAEPITKVAEQFNITLDEAFEAYKYCKANGLI
jgi:hypothetical protein